MIAETLHHYSIRSPTVESFIQSQKSFSALKLFTTYSLVSNCPTVATTLVAFRKGAVNMDTSQYSNEIRRYLTERYSSESGHYEPFFVTSGRRATIYLGSDWLAGCKLSRALKNQGYTVTLRALPVPPFKARITDEFKSVNYSPEDPMA